jgi:AsmA protein
LTDNPESAPDRIEAFAAMSKSSKIMLLAAGACVGSIVLLVSVAAALLRVNTRPRLEAIATQALGMQVQIGGPVAIGYFPGLHVAMADVHVRNRGAEVASAGELDLGIELLPLLRKQLRADQIELKRLSITVERNPDGKLNVESSSGANGTIPALTVANMSISSATLAYADKQSGKGFDAADCTLNVSQMRLSAGHSSELLKNLSLSATLACARIRTTDFTASDFRSSVEGHSGVVAFNPITMQLLGGHGSGDIRAEFSGPEATYQVRYRLTQFRLDEFFKDASPKSIGTGSMDLSTTLSLRGKTVATLVSSAHGVASLHGDDLSLAIGDLDANLAHYESSQSFHLIDFGAFFFAGPLGLAVTRGFDYARIFQGGAGSTSIRTLVSEWRVEDGVAQAVDVAMATQKNRVALKGGLDFVSGRYDEVTVAVVDAKGCPIVTQKVRGPFLTPVVEKPNVVGTFTGPARTLLRQARSLLGGKCDVFYAGSVAPPK